MDLQSCYTLANGVQMPCFGLGVFRAEPQKMADSVAFALQNGYRLVDTAAYYQNEAEVGQGVRDSGLAREDVFVTSKVWVDDMGYESTLRACDATLGRLGFDYLDLYLIHWPVKGMSGETWRALETLNRSGKVKAIGVCNFPVHVLDALCKEAEIMPMVNQVEFHPRFVRADVLDYCREKGILVQAWAPIARGSLNDEPALAAIAQKYGKTVPQVLLRWELQLGLAVIPKSTHHARILENAQVFDFALADAEMRAIAAMDGGKSLYSRPERAEV